MLQVSNGLSKQGVLRMPEAVAFVTHCVETRTIVERGIGPHVMLRGVAQIPHTRCAGKRKGPSNLGGGGGGQSVCAVLLSTF